MLKRISEMNKNSHVTPKFIKVPASWNGWKVAKDRRGKQDTGDLGPYFVAFHLGREFPNNVEKLL